MTLFPSSEGCPKGGVVSLTLTLQLTENEGFSPELVYLGEANLSMKGARLRALSSKYEFDFKDFKDFKEFDFKDLSPNTLPQPLQITLITANNGYQYNTRAGIRMELLDAFC